MDCLFFVCNIFRILNFLSKIIVNSKTLGSMEFPVYRNVLSLDYWLRQEPPFII